MASDTMLDDLKSWNANYYTTLVPFCILLYDYCLTFAAEVERCWSFRLNWALAFFYLNRYLALFGHVPVMMEYFWSTSDPDKLEVSFSRLQGPGVGVRWRCCHNLIIFHQNLVIVLQVVVACIVTMRVYALYEQSRKVLILYITVAALILAVAFWGVLTGKKEHPPIIQLHTGCSVTWSQEEAVHIAIAWSALLVFDSLVFSMTFYKSIVLPRPNRVNILDILLRDGTIYFGVMLASHLVNILILLFGGPFTRGDGAMAANVISSVMISRLTLNLRDPSLVLNGRRASFITSAELTHPITTTAGLQPSAQFLEGSYPGPTPESFWPVPHDIRLVGQGDG